MSRIDELDEFIFVRCNFLEYVLRLFKFIHLVILYDFEIRPVVRAVFNLYQDRHMHQLLYSYITKFKSFKRNILCTI